MAEEIIMSKYSGPDRRKHPRIPIAARVKLLDTGKVDYYIARDISIGGVGLISEQPIKCDGLVEMEISISGVEKLIKAAGKIVRRIEDPPPGYGVKFTRFAPHSKARLKQALKI